MKIYLDNRNVKVVDMTLEAARDFVGAIENPEELDLALDEAQGMVHSEEYTETYVVIRISQ